MLIAIVRNNIIERLVDHTVLFPDVSFPDSGPDAELLRQHSAYKLKHWKDHNPELHKLEHCIPYLENGFVYTVTIKSKTQDEIDEHALTEYELKVNEVRGTRDKLLADSDWTMTIDAPVDQQAWRYYRRDLRDVTEQPGFPFDVVFPDPPISIKKP